MVSFTMDIYDEEARPLCLNPICHLIEQVYLADVAEMYYLEEKGQAEIARVIGMTAGWYPPLDGGPRKGHC